MSELFIFSNKETAGLNIVEFGVAIENAISSGSTFKSYRFTRVHLKPLADQYVSEDFVVLLALTSLISEVFKIYNIDI